MSTLLRKAFRSILRFLTNKRAMFAHWNLRELSSEQQSYVRSPELLIFLSGETITKHYNNMYKNNLGKQLL